MVDNWLVQFCADELDEPPAMQPSQFSLVVLALLLLLVLLLHVDGDFFLKSYGDWWWQFVELFVVFDDEHPEELLGNASLDDTFVAIDADVVFGIVGLLPWFDVDELEVSGFVDEFVTTDGPGAVPTFGAGIFWQFGGSYASKKIIATKKKV